MLFMRFPEGRSKVFTTSYDDGTKQDARLIRLFTDHKIRGTFNLNSGFFTGEQKLHPGDIRITDTEEIRSLYLGSGMEIACHGLYHIYPTSAAEAEFVREVADDRRNLEALTGAPVRGMAYAYGGYDDRVLRILEMCGIVYSRTTVSTGSFKLPRSWRELHPTCHHDDERLFSLCDTFLSSPVPTAPLMFYLWGHSFEFDRNNNWDRIESFCDKIADHDDVWYATNMEIYEYAEAYSRLIRSYDDTVIQNPSAIPVWFYEHMKHELHVIAPGETITL